MTTPHDTEPPPTEATTGTDTSKPTPTPETTPDETSTTSDTSDKTTANREAAGYRHKWRETERERDGLRARLDRRDRADVERRAGERMERGADLWLALGDDLARFRDENGDVSDEAVYGAVDEVLRDRPYLALGGTPKPDPEQGRGLDTGQPMSWEGIVGRR